MDEPKIVTDIKEISSDPNYYVEIECETCGEIYCMYPNRVILPPECKCGNSDSGDWQKDWTEGNFGKFKLINASICIMSF